MVLDPIPQPLPVHFFGSRPQPPTSLCQRRNVLYMGWLRVLGSLKLQVSFAEYRLFYKALLHKRPIILRSPLIVATPYVLLSANIWLLACLYERHVETHVCDMTLPHRAYHTTMPMRHVEYERVLSHRFCSWVHDNESCPMSQSHVANILGM